MGNNESTPSGPHSRRVHEGERDKQDSFKRINQLSKLPITIRVCVCVRVFACVRA